MTTINAILGFILDHWTIISSILLFIFTAVYGYKNPKTSAVDYAKSIAGKLMFGLEKRGVEYLKSDEGIAKFKLVVESGYNLFPARVRLFISKPAFEVIVQELHDEAIAFLENEIKKQTSIIVPIIPVIPVVPTATVAP
jgi:hypothetical protein